MLELKLEKIAKVLLYAVPFLALIFIEGYYFPFVIIKTVYFRLLIQLGLSLYLLLLALNYKKYKPDFSLGLVLAGALLLVQFIAAIFGYDFYKSFWSDFERMEGLIGLIYLVIYLFLLGMFLKEKSDWLFYIRLILVSSVLVSLYGLAQKYNLLPVFEAGIGRVTSTIGNAAFLAGYLLLASGLGIYYYFNEARKNYKYFSLAAAGLNLLVLLLTSTRGAILGLVAGVLVFLTLNAIFLSGKLRKYSLAILAAMVLAGGGFFIFRSSFAGSGIEFINRLATISASEGSVGNRLNVWRMALNDFKHHPYLGVGQENFDIIYNKYYTPDIIENWFDRTHNIYLDQLMAGGVFALAAYLAILVYLFYRLFKARRDDYFFFAVLTGLLAAYAVHNFFVFDTLSTMFLYFFLIGLVGFEAKGREAATEAVGAPNSRIFNFTLAALVIINLLAFYKLVYLPVKINRAIYVGYYYVIADTFRSYENFKSALSYRFGSVEAAVQLNKMLEVLETRGSANADTMKKYYELTREKLKFASNNYPLDIKTKMYLGQLILNNYQDIKELDEAEVLFRRSMELSPSRVEPYYLLYNLYSRRGEKEAARAVLEDLAKRLPWYGGAKIMLMGDIYKEDPARAEKLYQEGIKQPGYENFGGLLKIISYLLDQKRYAETVAYYIPLLELEPNRYDYRLDLAKVYYLTNNFEAAIGQANLISANSPETLEGYESFLAMLNAAFNKQ